MSRSYLIQKRIVDLVCSTLGLLVVSPLFLCIAIWIKLDSKGPVFFRQERVGKQGHLFWIYKFRTMVHETHRAGTGLAITTAHDLRITRAGEVLRKYKLDELPQLLNIIRGEMSLVGPRPEVPRYVALYDEQQKQVLELVPGLTDEASIRYRDENQLLGNKETAEQVYIQQLMPDKLRLNMVYMKEASMKKDFAIIIRTICAIAGKEKASPEEMRP